MRLNSIKLSGFKSFAEPTHFMLPGQLVGVVGPNGCGKSNIMDAVRWVLGESKASELRGESMQDVIFNGSANRKAASRASVELVFDNSDHRAGGQWGQYTEIAVRRVLTREGASNYFINGQNVRRRDVQDVFLGTGLGPRAYAIIGQGTISRIIESRPEELRLFLEEAAGVSKYKERRRETQGRLQDTRDNLTRVQDILRELNANLEKLEQQAEVARQYNELQEAATLRQHQLWFLKRSEAGQSLERAHAETEQARNDLQSRSADLRHAEAELETVRQAHYGAGDEVNQAQGRLYEASAEVGKLEAEIRFVLENRERASQRLTQLQTQAEEWAARQTQVQEQIEELAAQTAQAEEQAEILAAQVQERQDTLPDLEQRQHEAQTRARQQAAAVAQVQQQIQVLAAEQRGLGEQIRQQQQRRERLQAGQNALIAPDSQRLAAVQAELAQAREEAGIRQERQAALQEQAATLEDERHAAQQAANAENARQTSLQASLQALQTLQEQVKTEGKLTPWLQKHGLDGLPGLWSRLNVEPDWESAVEAALRERMGALPISRLELAAAFASEAPPARLAFYALPAHPALAAAASDAGPPLLARLRLPDASLHALLAHWLAGCLTADNLPQALEQRARLADGQTIYTPAGHSVTAHGVSFYAPDSEQAGLLARAQEIDNLQKQLRAQSLITEQAQAALHKAEAARSDTARRLADTQRESAQTQARAHELQVQALQLQQQAEQAQSRSQQLQADLAETEAALADLHERSAVAEARFEELDMQLAEQQERHALLESQAQDAARHAQAAREQQRTLERQAQEAQFAHRSLQARSAEIARAIDTAAAQISHLNAETERARNELAQLDDASAQGGLQEALERKLRSEQDLAAQRSRYDELTARLRACDERRLQLERELEPLRQRITEMQLKEQAARLGAEQFTRQLTEAGADLEALARSIEESGVRLQGLQGEIDRLHRAIAALGAVNLAALQELATARERKQFLDAQSDDLTQAMTTLEDAIRKIDQETRELLGHTFHTVNEHFGRMFPELFGGGQARLVMTGEEILDAGVQVMAQPPGKKNQTIHLLSGGEKALTAIALVFAIFQLNPAPFCLLDEVDAPLDDANTERYARLVTAMSRQGTQFLFISHNKIAMEMAGQLVGVTMQEQGVSRIVAVDMESAVGMAG